MSEGQMREMANRIGRVARGEGMIPKRVRDKVIHAPFRRANQPCFYDNGGDPNAVVPSTLGTPKPSRDDHNPEVCWVWSCEFEVLSRTEYCDRYFYDVRYRDPRRNKWFVRRYIPGSTRDAEDLELFIEHIQSKRAMAKRIGSGPRRDTRRTAIRDWARNPILSTQLEPGAVIRCTSYKQFEREVERRDKHIPDGGIR